MEKLSKDVKSGDFILYFYIFLFLIKVSCFHIFELRKILHRFEKTLKRNIQDFVFQLLKTTYSLCLLFLQRMIFKI